MATLRDIKRKIAAVKKTQQITRAMNMVAAAKLRGAQQQMEEFRPYARKFTEVIKSLSMRTDPELHGLLQIRDQIKRVELIAMSADRGLCGSFNTNLLSAQHAFIKEKERQGIEVEITTVGRKARDFFRRRKANIRRSHEDIRKFTFDIASQIAEDIINAFLSHHVDEVYVIYSRFVNIVSQKPTTQKLLPFRFEDLSGSEIEVDETSKIEYLYEPSPDLLMEAMLPYYIKTQIYHFLLENNASEQAARMTAMDNATNNCKDMINKLTLVFNKVRQASITKELMDIVGGAEALKK